MKTPITNRGNVPRINKNRERISVCLFRVIVFCIGDVVSFSAFENLVRNFATLGVFEHKSTHRRNRVIELHIRIQPNHDILQKELHHRLRYFRSLERRRIDKEQTAIVS